MVCVHMCVVVRRGGTGDRRARTIYMQAEIHISGFRPDQGEQA